MFLAKMDDRPDFNDVLKIENSLDGAVGGEEAEGCSASEASSSQKHFTPNVYSLISIFGELTSETAEDYRLEIDTLEPTMENAILLNKAYQAKLVDLMKQLEVCHNENLEKQRILREEIEVLIAKINKNSDRQKKNIPFSFFGMPYFKDVSYNTAPPNEDTLLASKLGFRNVSLLLMNKQISKFEARRIRKGLKKQALELETTRLLGLRCELQKQLDDTSISEDEKKEIKSQIISIEQNIDNIECIPEQQLSDYPPSLSKKDCLDISRHELSRKCSRPFV